MPQCCPNSSEAGWERDVPALPPIRLAHDSDFSYKVSPQKEKLERFVTEEFMLQDSLEPKVVLALAAPLPNALQKSPLKQHVHLCSVQQNL